MATKTKAAANPPDEVTVPRSVLRQFVSLAEGLEQADNAYKTCQDTLRRAGSGIIPGKCGSHPCSTPPGQSFGTWSA